MQAERQRRLIEGSRRQDHQSVEQRCSTLVGFVREAWHVLHKGNPYIHGWHIDAVAQHLEAITYGKFLAMGLENRLLNNIPPGTMKSLLTSVFWPAWEWGPAGMPWLKYMSTSYKDELSVRDSRKMRDLVMSDWYQGYWGGKVRLTRTGEADFANSEGGERKAVAFKSLTGGRGHRVLIDDPHSTETAESEADLKTAIRIFTESVPTRMEEPTTSAIVITMQRLNEGDVSAEAIKLGYIHVMLPMEFEPERRCVTPIFEDPRTQEGELLFPERFPQRVVDRDKIPLGSFGVACQFQQRPSPRGGLMFKRFWFPTIRALPAGLRYVRGWDLAASITNQSPYTAGVKMAVSGKGSEQRFIICHVVRERLLGDAVKRLMKTTAEQDTQQHGGRVAQDFPQDPGQAGKTQAQDYAANLAGHHFYYSIESGEKPTRAQPVANQAEAGNVSILAGDWNKDFLDELEKFPTSKFMDQVDAMSRAFARLINTKGDVWTGPVVVSQGRIHLGDHPETGIT